MRQSTSDFDVLIGIRRGRSSIRYSRHRVALAGLLSYAELSKGRGIAFQSALE